LLVYMSAETEGYLKETELTRVGSHRQQRSWLR
jgi:hypothetical protein